MPTTPKPSGAKKTPPGLPGVLRERDAVTEAGRGLIDQIVLNHPSVEQVLGSLQKCRIAHFATHGISDMGNPSNSALVLQKPGAGPEGNPEQDLLSVYMISKAQLRYAQIAYLSACSTAQNKVAGLSDEVIHVVSGFQVAGFPHVIGAYGQQETQSVFKWRDAFTSPFWDMAV